MSVSPSEIVPGDRAGSWLVRRDGRDQSVVDPADPTWLGFDYVRRIADALDAVAPAGEPVRAVHIGGAGLSLPRYLTATRPRSAQVVLEPDTELTALVREHLPLPQRSGIKVRPVDGRQGIAALRDDAWGVVILDAYDDGVVPHSLTTRDFLADVARVVGGTGWLLANVADRAPFELARAIIAGLHQVFPQVAAAAEPPTLRGRRPGNLLVLAGPDASLAGAVRDRSIRSAATYRVLDERQVRETLGGGVVRTGGPSGSDGPEGR